MQEDLDERLPGLGTAPEKGPSRRFRGLDRAAAAAGGLTLALTPLLAWPPPWDILDPLQAALVGLGHWGGFLLLALATAAQAPSARWLALAGALAAFSPLARAAWQAPRLAVDTGLAWGLDPGRRPLELGRLARLPRTAVERSREVYAPDRGLHLTLWSPAEDQGLMRRRPVVLVLHPGGWARGRAGGQQAFHRALAGLGWVVADLDYRLAPRHPWPAQREDLLQALEHLRLHAKRLAVDPEHVVLLGRGAGAHLALDFAYATQDQAIRGVAAFYGPSDLAWAWEREAGRGLDRRDAIERLCGGPLRVPLCLQEASPLRRVNAGVPPTLLVHGGLDGRVSPEHSRRLAQRLREQGVPHQHLQLPWAGHGLDALPSGPAGQAAFHALERFLAATEASSRSLRP